MDQAALVTSARLLVDELNREGLAVTSAAWVRDEENETSWRLWLALEDADANRHDAYMRVATIVGRDFGRLGGLEPSRVKLVEGDHPVMLGVRRFQQIRDFTGKNLRNNLFGEHYVFDVVPVFVEPVPVIS
ncbi:hypothetical protein [Stappia sp.]|jgi:hypothetical protein|uniref:hypothetical protein n=1 Tax=Stappia sp. TaxID=1870903 RepID=UPI003D120148